MLSSGLLIVVNSTPFPLRLIPLLHEAASLSLYNTTSKSRWSEHRIPAPNTQYQGVQGVYRMVIRVHLDRVQAVLQRLPLPLPLPLTPPLLRQVQPQCPISCPVLFSRENSPTNPDRHHNNIRFRRVPTSSFHCYLRFCLDRPTVGPSDYQMVR